MGHLCRGVDRVGKWCFGWRNGWGWLAMDCGKFGTRLGFELTLLSFSGCFERLLCLGDNIAVGTLGEEFVQSYKCFLRFRVIRANANLGRLRRRCRYFGLFWQALFVADRAKFVSISWVHNLNISVLFTFCQCH